MLGFRRSERDVMDGMQELTADDDNVEMRLLLAGHFD
jgi:hypothetical protein